MSRRNEIKALEERVARLEDLAGVKPAAKATKAEASGSAAARSTSKNRRKKATKKSEG